MTLSEEDKKGKKFGSKHFRLLCSSKESMENLSAISYATFAHQTRPTSSMFCIRPTSTMSYTLSHWLGEAHV